MLVENQLKNHLDDFKTKLAYLELQNARPDYYWRLAFWNSVDGITPQIVSYERNEGTFDSGYLSHKWHSFPAKFYPQLVRALMNICSVESDYLTYDPYAGCGTSAVEAKVMGMNYIGIDVSKLAVLISQAKVDLDIDVSKIREEKDSLVHTFRSGSNYSWAYTDFELKWYNKYNRSQVKLLAYLVLRMQDERVRKLFEVALSSILRRVGNTKPGQIETRHQFRREKQDMLKLFVSKLDSMVTDIERYQARGRTNCSIMIEEKDASSYLPEQQVDFIITSPPYGNGLDYSKIHMLSIALLFGEEEVSRFKRSQTGTMNNAPSSILDTSFTSIGSDVIAELEKMDIVKAKAMSKYYVDMKHSIQKMFDSLKPDRFAVILVGPTKVNNTQVPNDDVLRQIGEHVGFRAEKTISWTYDKLRRSGLEHKIKGESIIILKKPR